MEVFQKACDELREYMEQHGYGDLDAFRGKALPFTG